MVDPAPLLLDISAAYDRWSTSYDAYDNPMVFMARAALAAAIPDAAGQSIVEFGCGTGRNLAELRARGARRLTGLDFSEGMLAKAHAAGAADVLLLHDMSSESVVDAASCDHALFSLSLEHVSDLAAPLREASRVVRGEGQVTIIEIHPFMSLGGAKAHFRDGTQEIQMPTFPHQFADYLRAFRLTGLTLLECREWRPMDTPGELPPKVLKRGADMPMVVTFRLARAKQT
ncbi:MAG: class I SAM-dependent methyltransferase [Beijerinckiaceae bacterium]